MTFFLLNHQQLVAFHIRLVALVFLSLTLSLGLMPNVKNYFLIFGFCDRF